MPPEARRGDAPGRQSKGRRDAAYHGDDRDGRQHTGFIHIRDLLLEHLEELDDGMVGAVNPAQRPYATLLDQLAARVRP